MPRFFDTHKYIENLVAARMPRKRAIALCYAAIERPFVRRKFIKTITKAGFTEKQANGLADFYEHVHEHNPPVV